MRRTVVRHVLGWTSLTLGIAGLFLPVIQGWLFIGIGALLLAPEVPLFARLVCWVEERSPRVRRALDRFRERFGGHDAPPPCKPDE